MNGFDELAPAPGPRPRTGPLIVMHVGGLAASRSAVWLLEALNTLHDVEVEFVQIGPSETDLTRHAGRVRVRMIGTVTRARAWALMQTASILYLRQGIEPGVRDHTAIASKTFEYLATGLPILAECPPGDNADLVRSYASCAEVVTSGNKHDLERALRALLCRVEHYVPRVNAEFAARFNRRNLTRELVSVLDSTQRDS
jgi:hypothetical protein